MVVRFEAPFAAYFADDIERDSERPGPQLAVAAEAAQGFQEPQRGFLRRIRRLFAVVQQPEAEAKPDVLQSVQQTCLRRTVVVSSCLNRRGVHAICFPY